jgi:hypothetical protein
MAKRRFQTSQDCRRYLASLVNRLEDGAVDPAIAGKAGYLVNIMIRTIEASDIEERLKILEDKVK